MRKIEKNCKNNEIVEIEKKTFVYIHYILLIWYIILIVLSFLSFAIYSLLTSLLSSNLFILFFYTIIIFNIFITLFLKKDYIRYKLHCRSSQNSQLTLKRPKPRSRWTEDGRGGSYHHLRCTTHGLTNRRTLLHVDWLHCMGGKTKTLRLANQAVQSLTRRIFLLLQRGIVEPS